MKSHPNTESLFHFYGSSTGKKPLGLISIPHSGEWIPEEFKPFLTGDTIAYKEDVDYKVHDLINIEKLNAEGVGVLVSHVHRVACDLNRSREDAILHWVNNTKGVLMVKESPSSKERDLLSLKYHAPYFDLLKDIFEELKLNAGPNKISFIDLHSMPSKPTAHHLKQNPNQPTERPDFCLSDLKGLSCTEDYIQNLNKLFTQNEFKPKINDPYFGGYVTKFAHAFSYINVVQIETNRALYMDEEKKEVFPERMIIMKEKLTNILINHFKSQLK